MQLQKQLSRKHKDKEYSKFTIVVPPKEIEKLGWKEGESLKAEVKNSTLIIKKQSEKSS